jgi:ERCC4-type nuclease
MTEAASLSSSPSVVRLIVDTREPSADKQAKEFDGAMKEVLRSRSSYRNVAFEAIARANPVADYLLEIDSTVVLAVERKTIADYFSSQAHDGRLNVQKGGLLARYMPHQVMYLVEGDLLKETTTMPKSGILGSMTNAILRDRVNVYHTTCSAESKMFIFALCRKCCKDPKEVIRWVTAAGSSSAAAVMDPLSGTTTSAQEEYYSRAVLDAIVPSKKKTLSNPTVCLRAMIETCYGVSATASAVLAEKYNSMHALTRAIIEADAQFIPPADEQPESAAKRRRKRVMTALEAYEEHMYTKVVGASKQLPISRFVKILRHLGFSRYITTNTTTEATAEEKEAEEGKHDSADDGAANEG